MTPRKPSARISEAPKAESPERSSSPGTLAAAGDPEEALAELAALLDKLEAEAVATLGTWDPDNPRSAAEWLELIGRATARRKSHRKSRRKRPEEADRERLEREAKADRERLEREAEALTNAAMRLQDVGLLRRELERGNVARVAADLAQIVLTYAATGDFEALLTGLATKAGGKSGEPSASLPPRRGSRPRGRPAEVPDAALDAFAREQLARLPGRR